MIGCRWVGLGGTSDERAVILVCSFARSASPLRPFCVRRVGDGASLSLNISLSSLSRSRLFVFFLYGWVHSCRLRRLERDHLRVITYFRSWELRTRVRQHRGGGALKKEDSFVPVALRMDGNCVAGVCFFVFWFAGHPPFLTLLEEVAIRLLCVENGVGAGFLQYVWSCFECPPLESAR